MQKTSVTLSATWGNLPATLFYERDYSNGRHWLDFPHAVRQHSVINRHLDPDGFEENYWNNLDGFRKAFAFDVSSAIANVDLIVNVPSRSGYHRPYLSAFKMRYPGAQWVRFVKTREAAPNQDRMTELRAIVELASERMHGIFRKVPPKQLKTLLIPDDVYAVGETAAVVCEKLVSVGMPTNVSIIIAAPLRIPPSLMEKGAGTDKQVQADLPPIEG